MRAIEQHEILQYQQDGVVYLPDFLDADWLRRIEEAFQEEMFCELTDLHRKNIGSEAERFLISTFNWRRFSLVTELGCAAPLPEIIANLLGSSRINFYGEQLFFKEAGSMHRTAFHQDAPYFHLTGDQCCTVWMPLDAVDATNGMMGYVPGSHRWGIYAANGFKTQAALPGSSLPSLPDIEGQEEKYDVVYYPAKPGDAIVHHVRTVHGSTGNTGKRDRRAFALRYLGNDIRYCERSGAPEDSQRSDKLKDGDFMDSEEFPLVWTADRGYEPA